MIIITFDDAINDENWELYNKLFPPNYKVCIIISCTYHLINNNHFSFVVKSSDIFYSGLVSGTITAYHSSLQIAVAK